MIIQSKKVWIADQFVPAAIEVKEGKIVGIFPYGTKDVDDDYGDKRIVPVSYTHLSVRFPCGWATPPSTIFPSPLI